MKVEGVLTGPGQRRFAQELDADLDDFLRGEIGPDGEHGVGRQGERGRRLRRVRGAREPEQCTQCQGGGEEAKSLLLVPACHGPVLPKTARPERAGSVLWSLVERA